MAIRTVPWDVAAAWWLLAAFVLLPGPAIADPEPARARAASVPLRRSVFELTDEIQVAKDCPVRKVRGKSTPICDLGPAFSRTFRRCLPELGDDRSGCVITVAPGTYELRTPQRICRPHVIRGAGGGAFGPATRIYTPDGLTPFRFAPFAECRAAEEPGAAGAELSHLALEAYAQTSTTPFFGLWLGDKVVIEHVHLRRYTQGIRINAGAKRKRLEASNANAWWLAEVWVDQSAHAGIHLDGPDTNVGLALRPVATSNCRDAVRFEKILGPCANIYSGDFLGSTFVAAQTASAKDLTTKTAYPGYVMGDSANSRSVCLGCYAEGDQLPSILAKNANAFGGLTTWSGTGWMIGPQVGGLSLLNDRDPKNPVRLVLGRLAAPGTFLELTPVSSEEMRWPLRLKLDLEEQVFRFEVGGLSDSTAMVIGAAKNASLGLGKLRLEGTPELKKPSKAELRPPKL
ncbi:MAG: hypothetical protein IPG45_21640 [Deltaproteobacteria bacterium]|jgi:hypothetical protein|nr:hypothetical protein [Deltaproteobacteria bacterium]